MFYNLGDGVLFNVFSFLFVTGVFGGKKINEQFSSPKAKDTKKKHLQ